jgi:hypothetical protein
MTGWHRLSSPCKNYSVFMTRFFHNSVSWPLFFKVHEYYGVTLHLEPGALTPPYDLITADLALLGEHYRVLRLRPGG